MKEVWRRLGRVDAINWIVIVVSCTLMFVGSFATSISSFGGHETLFVACLIAAILPVVALLLLARYVILPFAPPSVRPVVTVATLVLACVVRGVTYDQLLITVGLVTDSALLSRVLGSVSSLFIAAIVVSILVTRARDFTEQNESLLRSLRDLRTAHEELEARIAQRRTTLVDAIRAQLSQGLDSIGGSSRTRNVKSLKSLIDDVVRPISYQLGRRFDSQPVSREQPVATRIRWREVVRETFRGNPFHPFWMSLMFLPGASSLYFTWLGTNSLIQLGSSMIVFIALVVSYRWLWPFVSKPRSMIFRAVVFSMLSMFLALALAIVATFLNGNNLVSAQFVVAAGFYCLGLAWTVALVMTSRLMLKRTNEKLSAARDQLKRRVVRDNVASRHFEEGVSRVLHGPIQDAIASSLKRIQAMPAQASLDPEELERLRQPIDRALKLLEHPEIHRQTMTGGIEALAELWDGVVQIDLDLDPKAIKQASTSDSTSSIILEIVRETVSNAIRHGDATRIRVALMTKKSLDLTGSDLCVRIVNNGKRLSPATSPGLGSRMLDDFTVSWKRENTLNGVVVEAHVPTSMSLASAALHP